MKLQKHIVLSLAVFVIASGVVLLAVTIASTSNVSLNTTKAMLTNLETLSDPGAHDGDGVVFRRSNAEPPPDPADRSGIKTIDAGCTPSGDCMAKIKQAMNSNSGAVKITFGNNHPANTVFNFNSALTLRNDVAIEGATNSGNGRPVARVNANDIVVTVNGSKNLSLRNFDIDMNGCTTADRFMVVRGTAPGNIHISNINVDNGAATGPPVKGPAKIECTFVQTLADNMNGIYIDNISNKYMWTSLHVLAESDGVQRNIYVQNSFFGEYHKNVVRFDDKTSNVYIENNEFKYHAMKAFGTNPKNDKNANPVAFQPRLNNDAARHTNVFVRYNKFYARPDTNASTAGGSGDLLAFRGAKDFIVEYNEFYDSGEVALTVTAGLENGIIRYNTIESSDYSGIQFGNTSNSGNAKMRNVDLYGNRVVDAGLDDKNRLPDFVFPAIGAWNLDNACIVNNFIRSPKAMGIWVHDGSWQQGSAAGRFGPINETIFISKNDVKNSLVSRGGWPDAGKRLDYAQSGHSSFARDKPEISNPFRDGTTDTAYYLGLPEWGQAWATTIPGNDRDDDGFLDSCYSEANDNDPCVPDTTARCLQTVISVNSKHSCRYPQRTMVLVPSSGCL